MRIWNTFNRRAIVATTTAALAIGSTACTSPRPIYDEQGRYVGQREEFDAGKTLNFMGSVMLGFVPFGKNAQAAARAAQYGHLLRATGSLASASAEAPPPPPPPKTYEPTSRRVVVPTFPPPDVEELADDDRWPATRLPEYRMPTRPEPRTTYSAPAEIWPGAIPCSTEDVPCGISLSTTIGMAPLMIAFELELPPDQLQDAEVVWLHNGESFATGRSGRRLLTTPGEHEISVYMLTADGLELRHSRSVIVYARDRSLGDSSR